MVIACRQDWTGLELEIMTPRELARQLKPLRKVMRRVLGVAPEKDIEPCIKPYLEDFVVSCIIQPRDFPFTSDEFKYIFSAFLAVSGTNMDHQLEILLTAIVIMFSDDTSAKLFIRHIKEDSSTRQREWIYMVIARIMTVNKHFSQEVTSRILDKAMKDPAHQGRLDRVLLLQASTLLSGCDKLSIYRQQIELIGTEPLLLPLSHRVLNLGLAIGLTYVEAIQKSELSWDARFHGARFLWDYVRASMNTNYNDLMRPESKEGLLNIFECASLELAKVLRSKDLFDDINNVFTELLDVGASEQTLDKFVNGAYMKYRKIWGPYDSLFKDKTDRPVFVEYIQAVHSYIQHKDSLPLAMRLLSASYGMATQLVAQQDLSRAFQIAIQTVTFPTWAVADDTTRYNLLTLTLQVFTQARAEDEDVARHNLQQGAVALKDASLLVGRHLLTSGKSHEADQLLISLVETRLFCSIDLSRYLTAIYHIESIDGRAIMRLWGQGQAFLRYLNAHYDSDADKLASAIYDLAGSLEGQDELQLALDMLHKTPLSCSPPIRLAGELAIVSLRQRMGHPVAKQMGMLLYNYQDHKDVNLDELYHRYTRAHLDEGPHYWKGTEEGYCTILQGACRNLRRLCRPDKVSCPLSRSSTQELLGEVYSRLGMHAEAFTACSEAQALWQQWFNRT
jgi:hypothetical protein